MKIFSKYKHISIKVLQIETHEKKQTAKVLLGVGEEKNNK